LNLLREMLSPPVPGLSSSSLPAVPADRHHLPPSSGPGLHCLILDSIKKALVATATARW